MDPDDNDIISRYNDRLISVTKGGPKNYLQVADRLELLRQLDPYAKITTKLIDLQPGFACFHTRVQLSNGAVGEGIGSETKSDFTDYIEKAQTKSIGRAISIAGIGVQYALNDFVYEAERLRDFAGVDTPSKALTPAPGSKAATAPRELRPAAAIPAETPEAEAPVKAPIATGNWDPDGRPAWQMRTVNDKDVETLWATARRSHWTANEVQEEMVRYCGEQATIDTLKIWQIKELGLMIASMPLVTESELQTVPDSY